MIETPAGLPLARRIPSQTVAIPPFLTPNVVAEHEGVENRSAQPRDCRSAKGGREDGERREHAWTRERPLHPTQSSSPTLFSFLLVGFSTTLCLIKMI